MWLRGWKEENKWTNTDLGQLQAQEREFCGTLHSLCICRLLRTCIFHETSTKASSHADIFSRWLTQPLCRSLDLSSRLSDFCWLPSLPCFHLLLPPSGHHPSPGLHCWLLLSIFLCQLTLCLLWDLPLFVHFWSRRRSRAQALCLGFVPIKTKRSSDSNTPSTMAT